MATADSPLMSDRQAFWSQHQRWLWTVIYSRLREPEAVEDVMQELALALMRQPPLREPEAWAPWLYRLAVRQALLYRRQRGRQRRLQDRYRDQCRDGHGRSDAPGDPLDWLLARERRELVRAALTSLASRDREVLLLKYTEGWSYHQLASHLGLSHSAVEARLHKARQRLRAALNTANVFETKS